MKRLLTFVSRLILLLLVFLLGSVVYLDMQGFPPFLKQLVEEQLARQGWPTHFSSIRLDVFRGIVAKDAVVAGAHAPDRILARIDEVQIDWNWPRLLHGQNAIDAMRIANATISVPTPPDEIGPEVFKASEADATFRFEDDGSIQIDQLTGVYAGIRLRLAGRIKPRSEAELEGQPTTPETTPNQFVFVTKALRELDHLHGEEAPQLDVQFDLDLGAALDSQVTAKLFASDVSYRKLNVQKLAVDVQMVNGDIKVRNVTLNVGRGALTIRGQYDISAGNFDLKLDSNLDPNLFLPSLPPAATKVLRDFHVYDPPKIALRYVLSAETGVLPVLRGQVEFGAVECRSVPFHRLAFSFVNKGADVKITDVQIVMKEGQLTGHGQYNLETSDFAYVIDSTLDPRRLLPLVPPVVYQIIEPSWFETSPHISASAFGDLVDPDAFGYDATVTTKRWAYRGVAMNSASATVKVRRGMLDTEDLVIQRDDGDVRGSVFVNFDTERLAFNLHGTTNPSELVPLIGSKAVEIMEPYRFGPRTRANATGLIDFAAPANIVLNAHVFNEGFRYWKLTTAKATADVTITNSLLKIDNFNGEFYGGTLQGKASFTLTNDSVYQFDFATDHADVQKLLTAVSGKESTSRGSLTGAAWLTGQGSDLGTIRGGGKLTITDGVLWEIPLFGIFSHILNDIDAGLGTTKATKASATFTLSDKAAKTDDLQVDAGAFTMTGRGKVGFDGKLDFRVKGQLLRSVPGLNFLTWLLSNAFEYKVGGLLNDYNYRPTNLPKEILPHDDTSKPQPKDGEKLNAN